MLVRITVVVVVLGLTASACGNGALTLPEYVERAEELTGSLRVDIDAADDAYLAHDEPTVGQTQAYLDSRVLIRKEFLDALSDVEPPSSLQEFHDTALDVLRRFLAAEEELVALGSEAETRSDIAALWTSDVAAAWRAADADTIALCQAAEEELTAPEDLVEFGDLPWLPSETAQVVSAAFGCTRAAGE
jgi:hypothetical protein